MKYIFDTCSLRVLFSYPKRRFPTLWDKFDNICLQKRIISVKEVLQEINSQQDGPRKIWANDNKDIFAPASPEEAAVLSEMFKKPHFQGLIKKNTILKGGFEADPFIIARAKILNATVVTEEQYKINSNKIPNVCESLKIECTNLEGFMEKEGWQF